MRFNFSTISVLRALLALPLILCAGPVFADPVEEAIAQARREVKEASAESGDSKPMTETSHAPSANATAPGAGAADPEAVLREESPAASQDGENAGPEQAVYPGVKNCRYKTGGNGAPAVAIYYPEFGNARVDDAFRNFAEDAGHLYEENVRNVMETPDDGVALSNWEMNGFYTLEKPSPGIVSVSFNIYSYSGGAHGELGVSVLNYDLASGKRIPFDQIFGQPDKALEILSRLSAQKLREALGDEVVEDMLMEGTAPTADNFSEIVLRPAGITVEFQPYQVGPWSIGQPHVDIPLADLAEAQPNPAIWPRKTAD